MCLTGKMKKTKPVICFINICQLTSQWCTTVVITSDKTNRLRFNLFENCMQRSLQVNKYSSLIALASATTDFFRGPKYKKK